MRYEQRTAEVAVFRANPFGIQVVKQAGISKVNFFDHQDNISRAVMRVPSWASVSKNLTNRLVASVVSLSSPTVTPALMLLASSPMALRSDTLCVFTVILPSLPLRTLNSWLSRPLNVSAFEQPRLNAKIAFTASSLVTSSLDLRLTANVLPRSVAKSSRGKERTLSRTQATHINAIS